MNSLVRFDATVPMVAMTMAQFLQAARGGRVPGQDGLAAMADGETLPIARPGTRGLTRNSPASPRLHYANGSGGESPRVVTDSEYIVVRFGQLKGVRKVFDTHALYFPVECATPHAAPLHVAAGRLPAALQDIRHSRAITQAGWASSTASNS